ncbi:Pestheic acid cluster transcriptional regulator 2 [Vanrija pseudolonga]|uniref:Pestheic acid cluster transcriptional regulator 2 n=1 Tax=Vanrija pseudolonga TaxID=143232 RepID=A0AAF0YAN2_9TREE|nr:Pestheic acid cluster transcriptional regulator 2 [Vanrija pseudolonga]
MSFQPPGDDPRPGSSNITSASATSASPTTPPTQSQSPRLILDARPLPKGAACSACKERKIKCSAQKPRCTNCIRFGRTCEYPGKKAPRRSGVTRTVSGDAGFSPMELDAPRSSALFLAPEPVHHAAPSLPASTPGRSVCTTPHAHTHGHGSDPLTSTHYADCPIAQGMAKTAVQSQTGLTQVSSLPAPPGHEPVPPPPPPRAPRLPPPPPAASLSSFLPSLGGNLEDDQDLPAHWDQVDFSWLLNLPNEGTTDLADMDPETEEHCYRLYFSNQRSTGLEMNVRRFYERLKSQVPEEKPHVSLRNAMFLVACRASPYEYIRLREDAFLEAVLAAIDEGIQHARALPFALFDVMRATVLVTEWFWRQGRHSEAIIMASKGCRSAIASCYDQIVSATKLPETVFMNLRRRREPRDLIPNDWAGLAERIYGFWSVALLDISAAVATGIPGDLDLDAIRTPFPRPWDTYGAADPPADQFLWDLFDPTFVPPEHEADLARLAKATALLHYAVFKVHAHANNPNSWPNVKRTPFSQAVGVTQARQLIEAAIQRFVQHLPAECKTTTTNEEGQTAISSRAATLNILILAAKMFLYDSNSYDTPNPKALYYARQCVDIIRLLDQNQLPSLGVTIHIMWMLVGKILTREVKRLRRDGEDLAIPALESDIEVILAAMRKIGETSILVLLEAEKLELMRQGPPSDIDPTDFALRDAELMDVAEPHATPATSAGVSATPR